MTKVLQLLAVGITVATAFSTPVAAQPPGLVASVATSVYDALDEIAALYRATTGVTVALNAGGSNTLARQLVEGAKAGLFISADEIQMDAVEKAGRDVVRVEIAQDGRIVLVFKNGEEVLVEGNEWDEWRASG